MLRTKPGAATTEPIVFGENLLLSGMLTLPRSGARARGVVICAPFWHENTRTYRPLRTLAERTAGEGFPTLRFDWPGSGDSGDASPSSFESTAAWTLPVRQAVRALRETVDVDDVALIGLRIGATMALLAALEKPSVANVALLAPYVTGRAYLDDLRAFEAETSDLLTEPRDDLPELPEGAMEASGFLLSAAEVRTLEKLDLTSFPLQASSLRRALVLAERDDAGRTLVDRLRTTVPDATQRLCPELPHLWDGTNVSVLPRSCARLVCDWLRADRQARPSPTRARAPAPRRAVLEGDGFREEAVALDTSRGRRFAVACEPDGAGGPNDAWVVFLSAARVRRSGPSRLWTTYARAWARAGLPSLRLDVWGAGDSGGNRVLDELPVHVRSQYFPDGIGRDVADALAWLADHRQARRFTLIGMSSGGYWAFQTALVESRVHGVALVNLPTLHWDGRASSTQARQALIDIRHLAYDPRLWRHALRAGARPPVRELVDWALELAGRSRSRSYSPRLLGAFERLRAQGTAVSLVFSAHDRGVGYLERHLGRDYRPVLERQGVTTEIVYGPDHTFRPLWSHDVLRRLLEAHLRRTGLLEIDDAADFERTELRLPAPRLT